MFKVKCSKVKVIETFAGEVIPIDDSPSKTILFKLQTICILWTQTVGLCRC